MVNTTLTKTKIIEKSELDPWKLFLNAMRAPMTRDRYQTRVARFFNFIGIPGKTLEQKASNFTKKGKNDTTWALGNILKFIYFQRERVDKKDNHGADVYQTNSKHDYENHWLKHNIKTTCYPNKADLELHGWEPQGRDWEKE